MGAHVLVPLKRLDIAKSRLAQTLEQDERAALMRSLLEHALAAAREADVGPVTVVSGEQVEGADVFDDRGLPWNEALEAAMREVVREDIAAIVSADLPFVTADDIRTLVDATPPRGIAIARAHDGGTNAVAMRPSALVRTRFGEPQSASVHASLGVPSVIVDVPGLAFDVDTPADLERMRAEAAAWR